jgi:D-threonate/D-erythronate kinase
MRERALHAVWSNPASAGRSPAMTARVVIVADDLTGAMDVAGPLADRGLATLAVATREGCTRRDLESGAVVSINADSRHLSAPDAARRMQRIASELVDGNAEIVIKKIDSTLRGNVVSETLAMMEATGRSIAAISPAFPDQQRTLRDGVVHVAGVPLSDTDFARDALSAPPLQPLHLLFTRAAHGSAVQLLRVGQRPQLLDPGQRQILVFDAESAADLEQIVRILQPELKRMLLVGSAGIAQAVGRVCFPGPVPALRSPSMTGRILVVVGSRAQQSAEQVRRLLLSGNTERFVAPNGVVSDESVAQSQAQLVVLQATAPAAGPDSDAVAVARRLAESAAALLARGGIGALLVTGGDTAIAILQRLGQSTLRVMGTLLPGIPYSRIKAAGGDLLFVTKAGGFGAPDTFDTIVTRLRSSGHF